MAINIDAIRKKLAGISAGGSSAGSYKRWKYTEPGEYRIRVIPWPTSEDGMPFPEKHVYWLGQGPTAVKIVSPEHQGQKDPLKEQRIKLFSEAKATSDKEKAEELKEMAKVFKPRQEMCVAVIDRKREAEGPMLWVPSYPDSTQLMNLFLDEEINDYTDLKTGFDLKVTVSVSKKISPHTKKPVLEASIAPTLSGRSVAHKDPSVVKDWLQNLPDLDAYYKADSTDTAQAKLDAWLAGTTTDPKKDVHEGTARGAKEAPEAEAGEEEVIADKEEKSKKPAVKASKKAADVKALDDAFDELDSGLDD